MEQTRDSGAAAAVPGQDKPAEAADASEQKPSPGPPEEPGKSIVLFSDGTGNSSAKLFKTNVWRMYEAVELGPPKENERKQIAFYDNGVGTSALKPLAILGGVFGYGLKRNVLDIYRYACRNYCPGENPARRLEKGQRPGQDGVADAGDHIYGFGFSRGAFTMRIAIAMIARLGLVVTSDEAELDRKANEMWKVFRADYKPRIWVTVGRWLRKLRGETEDERKRARERTLDAVRVRNFHPIIRFVGVWDTVGAYGGPISELTAAVDNWLVRLSMPNYELADSVRCARQAVAIDDERDSFHPLLWDEIYEKRAIEGKEGPKPVWVKPGRLEQVWFTGMHSDVGGGYPDESLSYVSFLWMMEEAKEAGLRASRVMVERFQALANSAGPLHDSRSGVGAYYRYQPRRIAIWMDPLHPDLGHRRHPDRATGLIETIKIHESVAARIATGTDRYAPIPLAAPIRVVPPQTITEASETVDEAALEPGSSSTAKAVRLIPQPLQDRFENAKQNATRVAAMHDIWGQVRRRRVAYYVSLILTLMLVTMPLWVGHAPVPPFLASGHGLFGGVVGFLPAVLPGFVAGLVTTWVDHPFYVLALLILLLISNGIASGIERRLRDDTRHIWNESLDLAREAGAPITKRGSSEHYPLPDPDAKLPEATPLQKLRSFFRWRIVPFLILLLLLTIGSWILAGVATRARLAALERDALCPASGGASTPGPSSTFQFTTDMPCHSARFVVERGVRYVVDIDVTRPWTDGRGSPAESKPIAADPRGLSASDLGWAGFAGLPFRRAVTAGYLQPVAHIRSERLSGPILRPLVMEQRGARPTLWRGEFVAEASGELSLFANEAVLPFRSPGYLYTDARYGNLGSAQVTVTRADSIPPEPTRGPPAR